MTRSYEVCCLRELVLEKRRLSIKKVLSFDNVWFVMDSSLWSWLGETNIITKQVQVWISLMTTKAATRTCDFQQDTPHRLALNEETTNHGRRCNKEQKRHF